jgi:hypothetical protein
MNKMKIILKKVFILSLMLTAICIAACDKTKWRAKDYGGPPSWQNDFSLPDSIGGEPPFS